MRAVTLLLGFPSRSFCRHPFTPRRSGPAAFGTWQADGPGVSRHIRPADLPPPSLTRTTPKRRISRTWPKVVRRRKARCRMCRRASQCRCSPGA